MQRNDRPVKDKKSGGSKSRSENRNASAGQSGGGDAPGNGHVVASSKGTVPTPRIPRLLKQYREDVLPVMMKEFGYTVPLQVPRLEKVVINVGLGEALTNANAIESVTQMVATISGQRPIVTKAKKSIAGFNIREGMRIGTMVTLRSKRMYEFVERLINAALPRIRDFRGVSRTGFDGRGNYSLGLREQVMFPEIDYNRIDRIRGLQVTFVTTAKSDAEGRRLLELFGMPFERDGDQG